MDERAADGLARLVEGFAPGDAERAVEILGGCPVVSIKAGEPYFRSSLPEAALLLVDEGFSVLRLVGAEFTRSIVTCEAGPGRVLLPPAQEEVLFGLVNSRLVAIPEEALRRLLLLPTVARRLLEHLATTLGQNQETIGNFANTRHVERVRRKLIQLARSYGRVGRDGIRIQFPVSHSVLAEMIGSSRETVTRALDDLQRVGFVVRRGHTYRLQISPERLLDAA